LPCDPAQAGEAVCAGRFIDTFGRRAFRRPLTTAEKQPLEALYADARAKIGLDFTGALGLVIQAFLQSPRFLYLWQGDDAPALEAGLVRCGPWEIASRLSYFLWSTMPDEALFAAAAAGKLGAPADIDAQAQRMLADPRARPTLRNFYTQWLGLAQADEVSKDPAAFPTFTPELRASMAAEFDAFVTHVTFEGDARLETLLTAPFSFLNPSLAKLYGVAGVAGPELRRRDLDPVQRAGVLTQGLFLAAHALPYATSPVQRGKVVRRTSSVRTSLPPRTTSSPPRPPSPPPSPAGLCTSSTRSIRRVPAAIP
jgi:hypothetical protein